MLIYGVPESVVSDCARRVGVSFQFGEAKENALTGKLILRRDVLPVAFQRTDGSKHEKQRKMNGVCFHGHWQFMEAVFHRYPNARIKSGLIHLDMETLENGKMRPIPIDYDGKDVFYDLAPKVGKLTRGNADYQLPFEECCTCTSEFLDDVGYSQLPK